MTAFQDLVAEMCSGRLSSLIGDSDGVKTLLSKVYEERYHKGAHHRDRFQARVNLQKSDESASYAGWITS
ncbi:MAG: hypothetical protein ACYCW6_18300, partial [Candidatus Xenobia bacterium]